MSSTATTISLKLSFEGETRRAQFSQTKKFDFDDLTELVANLFPRAPKGALLGYVDDDGDEIHVSTDAELQAAIFLFNQGSIGTSLRLNIKTFRGGSKSNSTDKFQTNPKRGDPKKPNLSLLHLGIVDAGSFLVSSTSDSDSATKLAQSFEALCEPKEKDDENETLTVEDALEYIAKVKDAFDRKPQAYTSFLDVMSNFKKKKITREGAMEEVSRLFTGHDDLLVGFARFLPKEQRADMVKTAAGIDAGDDSKDSFVDVQDDSWKPGTTVPHAKLEDTLTQVRVEQIAAIENEAPDPLFGLGVDNLEDLQRRINNALDCDDVETVQRLMEKRSFLIREQGEIEKCITPPLVITPVVVPPPPEESCLDELIEQEEEIEKVEAESNAISVESCDSIPDLFHDPNEIWTNFHGHEFRLALKIGDACDAHDSTNKWYEGKVTNIRPAIGGGEDIKIHFHGWSSSFDEWIQNGRNSDRIQPRFTNVPDWRSDLKEGDLVEFNKSSDRSSNYGGRGKPNVSNGRSKMLAKKWFEARVLKIKDNGGLDNKAVRLIMTGSKTDRARWVSMNHENIVPLGTHLKNPSPEPASTAFGFGAPVAHEEWACTLCTCRNKGNVETCVACGTKMEDVIDFNFGNSEPSKNSDKYKRKICHSWTETGSCLYGTRCRFAHGVEELRQYSADLQPSPCAGGFGGCGTTRDTPQSPLPLKGAFNAGSGGFGAEPQSSPCAGGFDFGATPQPSPYAGGFGFGAYGLSTANAQNMDEISRLRTAVEKQQNLIADLCRQNSDLAAVILKLTQKY